MSVVIAYCMFFSCPVPPPPTLPSLQGEVAPAVAPPAPTEDTGMGNQTTDVEQWRGLVSSYFTNVELALCIVKWESGGNPNARNTSSGAAGLFQVMPFWAGDFGISYSSLFDPYVNVEIASKIHAIQGWGAWNALSKC